MFWWKKRHSNETLDRVRGAYPSALSADVLAALSVVPAADLELSPDDIGSITVCGESVGIPYRIYFPEPPAASLEKLTRLQRLVLSTLFTRHHDGYVRERYLIEAIGSPEPWVAPFVVQLLGEYVIEIAEVIEAAGVPDSDVYQAFAQENPQFCERTSARIVSYWNAYYRRRIPEFTEYAYYRAADRIGAWVGRVPRSQRRR